MVEAEMMASKKFTEENFGLKVGDGFPELVREIAKSDKLTISLFMNVVLGALMGKDMAEDAKVPEGQKPDFGAVILKHLTIFEGPLSLLYWGIEVGRKMEAAERDRSSNTAT